MESRKRQVSKPREGGRMGRILVVIGYTTALCYETLPTSHMESGAPPPHIWLMVAGCSEKEEATNDRNP